MSLIFSILKKVVTFKEVFIFLNFCVCPYERWRKKLPQKKSILKNFFSHVFNEQKGKEINKRKKKEKELRRKRINSIKI